MSSLRARFLFPLLVLCSLPAHAETLTGIVVSIADGDTITVLDANRAQHKIRLAGIGAPEKAQSFGQRSKQNMSALVFGKQVDVQWNKRDRYRRIVGKVMVQPAHCRTCQRTQDAGLLAQLTVGLAWWYRKYSKDQSPEDAGWYEFAEYEARAKRAGLWADRHLVPPWDLAERRTVTHPKQWPATIDEAVGVVVAALSAEERARITAMAQSELVQLHFGLGMWIRNNLGLWKGNDTLIRVIGDGDPSIHTDDASMVIIDTVWKRLREIVPKVH